MNFYRKRGFPTASLCIGVLMDMKYKFRLVFFHSSSVGRMAQAYPLILEIYDKQLHIILYSLRDKQTS